MKLAIYFVMSLITIAMAEPQLRDGDQTFGRCSRDEVELLFKDYPEECLEAYNEIQNLMNSAEPDLTNVGTVYSKICLENCKSPVLAFRQSCNAQTLTDPIIQACEQNADSKDLCILDLYENDGTDVAENCFQATASGECSEECRDSLLEFQSDLGCCVNSLSTFGYDILQVADPELWSLCEVELPEDCNPPLAQSRAMVNSVHLLLLMVNLIVFTIFYTL